MEQRYDAAVIGTGPAGLSAAITLALRNRSLVVFGGEPVSHKVSKSHEIQNYLGLPSVAGAELAAHFLAHARQMGIQPIGERITAIYAMGDYYALQSSQNRMYEAKTVILASGVDFGTPYPGEEAFLGRGVSYCATCDAPLYKGKSVAVIGTTPEAEAEAAYLSEIAAEVTYLPTYAGNICLPDTVRTLRSKVKAITGQIRAQTLTLEDGELAVDGIFILRQSVRPAQLVPGLIVDDNHVAVNRQMETNLPGCFACGDLTGTPYQYIKAAGEGNVAALSAVKYLEKRSKPSVSSTEINF